jgi:hypothetical protein
MNNLNKKRMDKKLSCVLFSMTRKKRRREGREQCCQSTETTTSIHFRTLCRSVGGSNSSDFFSLSVLATQSTEERKKREVIAKGDVDLSVYMFE